MSFEANDVFILVTRHKFVASSYVFEQAFRRTRLSGGRGQKVVPASVPTVWRRAGPRPDREKTRSARPNTIGLTSRQRGSRGGRENMAARGRLVSTGLRVMLFR